MIQDYLNNITHDSNKTYELNVFLKYFNYMNLNSINYKFVIGFIISIISFTAIFGNALVIAAIIFEKSLRTVSNVFILSLSISDLMIGLFVMPLSGTIILLDKWVWGAYICRSWLSIDYIASTASIFNLFTLSVERYLSIAYPLKFMTYQSKTKAKIAVLIVWLTSSLWIIPINSWAYFYKEKYNISIQNFATEKCTTDFETDKIFKIVSTIFNFYIPCIGMIIIYSKIFRTIIKRSKSEIGSFCYTSYNKSKTSDTVTRKNPSKSSVGSNCYDSISNNDQKYDALCHFQAKRKTVKFKKVNSNASLSSNSEHLKPSKRANYIDSNKILKKDSDNSLMLLSFVNNKGKLKDSINSKDMKFAARRNALIEKCPPKNGTNNSVEYDKIKKTNFIFGIFDKFISKKLNNQNDVYSVRLKQQIKAAKQLGILLLAFLITWMPYFITFIVVAFCADCVSDNLSTLTVWLGYLNSAINPLLYPQCNSSFKHAFRKMLRISSKRRKNQNDIIKLMHNTYK